MEDCLKMSKTYQSNKEIIFFLKLNECFVNEKFDKIYIHLISFYFYSIISSFESFACIKLNEI